MKAAPPPLQPIDRRAHPANAVFSTWAAPDGWALRRTDWRQGEGAPVRGSLLFANGRGDFIEKYLEPIAHWHDEGWNVTSFDWRGQGDSRGDIVGGHLDSFDPLVADLDALVRAWLAETPGPHVLVGHSMGGHLVLRLLVEKAPKVDAVVLSAPMIGVNTRPLPAWAGPPVARLLSLVARKMPTSKRIARQKALTNSVERYEDEAWWKAKGGYELGPPSWGWLSAAFASMRAFTPERLARVKLPVLLIGTDADRLVSAAAIRRAAALLPQAELHMFPDAAHEILRESDEVRLETMRRIDDFLDRQAPA